MSGQRDYADQLVDELRMCGHDDIDVLDLLDALASCGLALHEPTEGNPASLAYFAAMGVEVDDQ